MPDPQTVDSDELLAALLERLAAEAAAGRAPDIEAVAREHPELAVELRALWATAVVVDDVASLSGLEEVAADSAPATNGPLPRRLGDFELLEELGRGGMGVVYKARQLSLGRTVALKMILRGELASTADLVRFRGEAESAARLDHPHIVPVHEVGEHNGQPFFSMRLVEGTTLARRITDGPLAPREAAALLVPVCRAIAHAHRQGVLHRDLKPSNILIDAAGQPHVTDFGLAKRVRGQELRVKGQGNDAPDATYVSDHWSVAPSLTHSGAILGTPGYIAPEQAAGQRGEISAATDVYSLGAVLYAMLTGRAPFQAASPVDTVLMVLEQDPPPPRVLNPQADPDLEMIALKALQKPPDLRYASADALADDLEAYLRHEPIAARSSHFSQVLSRAFRPTHHAAVLENWGLLWMWHALVLLALCVITNWMQLQGVGGAQVGGWRIEDGGSRKEDTSAILPPSSILDPQRAPKTDTRFRRTGRFPYFLLWTAGLGTWAVIFWNLRRRAGPVTFVERQIAHIWAASMACSTLLFAVEAMLGLPVLTLSPVLSLIAAAVFVVKAGILSGEFYIHAAVLFATCVPMAVWPQYGITIFGLVSAATFLAPGWKFHRQRVRRK